MKELFIEGTSKTPQIDFNHLSGEIVLFGKSIPENAAKIYEPLLGWIEEYIASPCHITNFRLHLEYFNSASMLWYTRMIKALCRIKREDSVLFISAYFDMDDFENMDTQELKDIVSSLIENAGEITVSVSVKIYGTDTDGKIVKETTILI